MGGDGMIKVDMPMPESCAECPFNIPEELGCLLMANVPAWLAEVFECTDRRAEHCPLEES